MKPKSFVEKVKGNQEQVISNINDLKEKIIFHGNILEGEGKDYSIKQMIFDSQFETSETNLDDKIISETINAVSSNVVNEIKVDEQGLYKICH